MLTSRSFTTLESDHSDERRLHLRYPQSHSAETTHNQRDILAFSSSSRSVTSIGRTALRISQSDESTQTDMTMFDDDKLLSASRSQPETYTTSLYIDSLAPVVSVPLRKDTEVMVVLDGSHSRSNHHLDSNILPSRIESMQNDGDKKKRFLSTVEVRSVAVNGRLTLTPVTRNSVEVTEGERSPEVMEGSSGQQEWTTEIGDRHPHDATVHHSMFNSVSYSMVLFYASVIVYVFICVIIITV